MKKNTRPLFTLILTAAASLANAQPVEWAVGDGGNGHFYEVVPANAINWDDANTNANGMTHLGVRGHLATLTSADEDAFVNALRESLEGTVLSQPQAWIGGFQAPDSAEPGGGWQWVNGEGPFPGNNAGPAYANWAVARSEPNNAAPGEGHLTLGRYSDDDGWNDEGSAPASIGGYIVEYDIVPATSCTGGSGCQSTPEQTLTFPATALDAPDARIGFSRFDFSDPRVGPDGLCSVRATLDVFGDGSLLIPPYLCGSPSFVVVKTETSGVVMNEGTVLILNDPVPGNLFICEQPVTTDDPQKQDVVVWQESDRTDMLEDEFGGTTSVFDSTGSAGEFTDGCSSSRGRVKSASFYVIGMHIDFGVSYVGNESFVFDSFVALTRYKMVLLQEAVERAKADNALRQGDYKKLQQMIGNAIKLIDRSNYAGALQKVDNFLKFAERADYAIVPGENYDGEHLMRGGNVRFMLAEKVIPFAP